MSELKFELLKKQLDEAFRETVRNAYRAASVETLELVMGVLIEIQREKLLKSSAQFASELAAGRVPNAN